MKIKYEKPMLAVEHYELTQAIAACERRIGFMDSQCVQNDPDAPPEMRNFAKIGYFIGGYCAIAGENMNGSDGMCYHTNANAAFSS